MRRPRWMPVSVAFPKILRPLGCWASPESHRARCQEALAEPGKVVSSSKAQEQPSRVGLQRNAQSLRLGSDTDEGCYRSAGGFRAEEHAIGLRPRSARRSIARSAMFLASCRGAGNVTCSTMPQQARTLRLWRLGVSFRPREHRSFLNAGGGCGQPNRVRGPRATRPVRRCL